MKFEKYDERKMTSFFVLYVNSLVFCFLSIFYAITVVPFFSPLYIPPPCTSPPSSILPTMDFMSMGCTYKFFGFSISYTILNYFLSILCLPVMLLIPCTFSPFFPPPLPADNPPCGLHFCDSVPVLVVCLVFVFF